MKKTKKMKKEVLTQNELMMATRAVNAKIRELNLQIITGKNVFKDPNVSEQVINLENNLLIENEIALQEYKLLQQKLTRLYKFGDFSNDNSI